MMKMPLALVALLFGMAASLSAAPLRIDRDSSEFRVDVRATGHAFELFLEAYQSNIVFADNGSVDSAVFGFDMKHLKSDNKKRDRKMLEWIEYETNPLIRYELDSVEEVDGKAVGVGTVTLHGVSKPVRVPFEVVREGDKVTLTGDAVVDYRDFGLEVITMFFMKVKPELEISFKLVGTEVE